MSQSGRIENPQAVEENRYSRKHAVWWRLLKKYLRLGSVVHISAIKIGDTLIHDSALGATVLAEHWGPVFFAKPLLARMLLTPFFGRPLLSANGSGKGPGP
eukprot:6819426-Karenia_brevis.AAC.1